MRHEAPGEQPQDSHEHNTFFTFALHFDDGLRPAEV